MILRWLFSTPVRNAVAMRKHVYRMLCAQRDLLNPAAMQLVSAALLDLQKALEDGVDKATLKKDMAKLEQVANKWLKPYPHAAIRENVEVLLVALAVAMSIRTFFVQPFKIPTGSMQPTLFGVTPSPGPFAGNQPDLKIPGQVARFYDFWVHGLSYYNIVAPENGELQAVGRPQRFLLFNLKQDYLFNHKAYTVWFPA